MTSMITAVSLMICTSRPHLISYSSVIKTNLSRTRNQVPSQKRRLGRGKMRLKMANFTILLRNTKRIPHKKARPTKMQQQDQLSRAYSKRLQILPVWTKRMKKWILTLQNRTILQSRTENLRQVYKIT